MACLPIKDGILCVNNSYAAHIEDANARLKRGQRQHYCFATGRWEWGTDCGCRPMIFSMAALEGYARRLVEAGG